VTSPAPVKDRIGEAEKFLNCLYAPFIDCELDFEADRFYTATCAGWKQINGGKPKAVNFRELPFTDTINAILSTTQAHIDKDLWIQVCLNNGKSKSIADATQAPGFWVEIDQKNLKDPEQINTIIDYLDPQIKPSMVINSGNGIHCYWLFTQFVELSDAAMANDFDQYHERMRFIIQAALKPYLTEKALDSIQERGRVLRVPGTINKKNAKNPKPVTLIHCEPAHRFEYDDFKILIDQLCSKLQVKIIKKKGKTLSLDGQELNFETGLNLPTSLWDKLTADHKEFLNTTGYKRPKLKSPSEYDQALANFCRMSGLNPQECLSCILATREAQGEDLHLNNPGKYIRTIETAWNDLRPLKAKKNKAKAKLLPLDEIEAYAWNDLDGDADLFFRLAAGKFLRDPEHTKGNAKNTWFKWNGHKWEQTDNEHLNAVSWLIPQYEALLMKVRTDLKALDDEDPKAKGLKSLEKILTKKIKSIKTPYGKKNVLENAIIRHTALKNTAWNKIPYLLPFTNGVYNLKSFKFEESKPKNLNTMVIPYDFDPAATCPNLEKMIRDQFQDPEVQQYFHVLNGLCLPGTNDSHAIVINWGPAGRNGKSLFYEALLRAMGDFGSPMRKQTVMMARGIQSGAAHTADRAALVGRRLWILSEATGEVDTDKACKLVGGDSILSRSLNQDFEIQELSGVPYIQTNNRPKAKSDAAAFWERAKLVKWDHRFIDSPAKSKPYEHKRDPELKARVFAELPGIMNYLIAGYKKYVAAGKRIFIPETIKAEMDRYRYSEDGLEEFVHFHYRAEKNAAFPIDEAHRLYMEWAEDQELIGVIKNTQKFSWQLGQRFNIKKLEHGKRKKPTHGETAGQKNNGCACFLGGYFQVN
jgi:P4 family phage/plasmid primase-like protien